MVREGGGMVGDRPLQGKRTVWGIATPVCALVREDHFLRGDRHRASPFAKTGFSGESPHRCAHWFAMTGIFA